MSMGNTPSWNASPFIVDSRSLSRAETIRPVSVCTLHESHWPGHPALPWWTTAEETIAGTSDQCGRIESLLSAIWRCVHEWSEYRGEKETSSDRVFLLVLDGSGSASNRWLFESSGEHDHWQGNWVSCALQFFLSSLYSSVAMALLSYVHQVIMPCATKWMASVCSTTWWSLLERRSRNIIWRSEWIADGDGLTLVCLSRVLILDWDVHHGQGTQYAFYDTNKYGS